MKDALKNLKLNLQVSALLTVALGVFLIGWQEMSIKVVSIGFGVIIILCGIIHIVSFIMDKEKTILSKLYMVVSIILIVIGAWIVLSPDNVKKLIPIVMSLVIIFHGVMDFKHTITLKKLNYSKWYIAIIVSLIAVLYGILTLLNPMKFKESTLFLTLGIGFILDGISELWIVNLWIIQGRRLDKEEKQKTKEKEEKTKDLKIKYPYKEEDTEEINFIKKSDLKKEENNNEKIKEKKEES